MIVWLTGLPCSGKTTIAKQVLNGYDNKIELLDGDAIRGEVSNQDFSIEGRRKHLEYIAMTARYLDKHHIDVICSFVSPERDIRDKLKRKSGFHEVYVKCSLEKCKERDVKGMYKKAMAGEIKDFTGVSAPYEEPLQPDLVLDAENSTVEECAKQLYEHMSDELYD